MEQFNIYKDGVKVSTTDDTAFEFTNLQSDQEYTLGVSRVIDGRESKIVHVEVTTNEEPQPVEPVVEVETVSKKYEDLTVAEIKEVLDSKGIEYSAGDRKKELYEKMVNNA